MGNGERGYERVNRGFGNHSAWRAIVVLFHSTLSEGVGLHERHFAGLMGFSERVNRSSGNPLAFKSIATLFSWMAQEPAWSTHGSEFQTYQRLQT